MFMKSKLTVQQKNNETISSRKDNLLQFKPYNRQKQTGKTVQNITSVFVNNSLGIPLLGFFKFAGKELCRNFYFMYIFITLKGK